MSAHSPAFPSFPASIDGRIVRAGEGTISIDDPAFLHGLAVFDTLRVEDRARCFERRHLERLEYDALALGIVCPSRAALIRAWDEFQAHIEIATFALRTTLTRGVPGRSPTRPGRGPMLIVQARAIEDLPSSGVVVTLERELAPAGDALDRSKTTSRARWIVARERAVARGAFDALFVRRDGTVVDATVANVWALVRGRLVTPPVEDGALPGIVRTVLFEELIRRRSPHAEVRLTLADLALADEVFLTNALQSVIPVSAIQDLRDDLPGAQGSAAQDCKTWIHASAVSERG